MRAAERRPASIPAMALQVTLDFPLPTHLTVGLGTAVFVAGTCFDPGRELGSLKLVIDGVERPVDAFAMPRLDYFRELHPHLDPYQAYRLSCDPESTEDPRLRSYRSGFWGILPLPPGLPAGEYPLRLETDVGEGAQLGRIAVASSLPPPRALPRPAPTVALCMATYNPPVDLLRRQVQSIRDQTHESWVCLISDDCSAPERFAALQEAVGSDSRFVVSRSSSRLGFYLNFERALAMVPPGVSYVALADQDDYWYPDKLDVLLAGIGDAQLVYSDARIVSRDGAEIAPTYWSRRRKNHEDLESLLVANCVTGAASLFRRELLERALPFPPRQFAHYHDHWIGLVARMVGRIEYIDRPLYDYVQHGRAALGHAAATRIPTLSERLSKLGTDQRERVRFYRATYFRDVQRLMAFALILRLRAGEVAPPPARRVLDEFLALERSWPAVAKLAWRAVQELAGRSETVGAEWSLLRALLWRRLVSASARDRPTRRVRLDAVPPANLAPRGERRALGVEAARFVAEKIEPLELAVSDAAVRRVNVLIPTLDLEHFFGGYIAKFNLARRLAERGARVRLVCVDPVGPLPRDWKKTIESYRGLAGLFDRVELEFARATGSLEVSPEDGFVATTWWTAHVAAAAVATLGRRGFVYLIQEYEPLTFPLGTLSALAAQSYRFAHFALFSTELLQDYFRARGIGVYVDGGPRDQAAEVFQNAITAVAAPTAGALAARASRGLLFCSTLDPSPTPPATCSNWASLRWAARSSRAHSAGAGSCGGSAPPQAPGASTWAATRSSRLWGAPTSATTPRC